MTRRTTRPCRFHITPLEERIAPTFTLPLDPRTLAVAGGAGLLAWRLLRSDDGEQGRERSPAARWRFRPAFEGLEDRFAPAVINVVSNLIDQPNFPVITAGHAGTAADPFVATSLRSAISFSNNNPGGNTINLTVAGTYNITIPPAQPDDVPSTENNQSGDFDILPSGGDLTIQNTSGGSATVSAAGLSTPDRVFDINPNFNPANPTPAFRVTMSGFTITGGNADVGGGIRDTGNASLTLDNMVVTGNQASGDGGGVVMLNTVNAPWTLTLQNGTVVSNNSAGDAGGGIDTDGSGNVVVNNSTIAGNTSVNQGAGIWLDTADTTASANLTMTASQVSTNQATSAGGVGGGIGVAGSSTVSINNSSLLGNFARATGGAFGDENGLGTLTVTSSLVSGNNATGDGGGIAESGPSTTITTSEIDNNGSGGFGGGLVANGSQVDITRNTFAGNFAGLGGGGLQLAPNGQFPNFFSIVENDTITGNTTAGNGGGIGLGTGFTAVMRVANDTVNGNSASIGGGVYQGASTGTPLLLGDIFAGNTATLFAPDYLQIPFFQDVGGNVVGQAGTASGNTGFSTANGDQTGTAANPLAPGLGALADNGGPAVGIPGNTLTLQTEALLAGSPALGKGFAPGAPPTDERGIPRNVGNGPVDAGAFEHIQLVTAATGTTAVLSEGVAAQTVLATFTDSDPTQVPSDFVVTVDWGDGSAPTAGTVVGGNGAFTVTGAHAYAEEGNYTVTVTINQRAIGNLPVTATSTAVVPETDLTVTASPISAVVGTPFTGTVATFTDPGSTDPASDFTAVIDYGDGSGLQPGTISGSNGSYTVNGTHTFAAAGSQPVTVLVIENGVDQLFTTTMSGGAAGVTTPASGTGTVLLASVPGGFTLTFSTAFANLLGGATMAHLHNGPATGSGPVVTDVNGNNVEFTFAQPGPSSASVGPQTFSVSAPVVVQLLEGNIYENVHSSVFGGGEIRGQFNSTNSSTATATVVADTLAATFTPPAGVLEHVALNNVQLATFTDTTNPTAAAAHFTATITWDDNTTSSGTVNVLGGGNFSVTVSGHTYADEGSFPVSVQISVVGGAPTTTASGTVTAGENDSLTGHAVTIHATEGTAFSGTVATFTDTDTTSASGDFTVTIDWGDGSPLDTTTGTVSGGNGTFTVAGSHTYADEGTHPVKVTLSDKAPGTASATANSTAVVAEADLLLATVTPPAGAKEDVALTNVQVATFTDTGYTANVASDFQATIYWGDGTSSAGTVSGGNGNFTVKGSHTYNEGGSYRLRVVIRDVGGTAGAMDSATIRVAQAPARQELQDALAVLNGLKGSVSKKDASRLNEAISDLSQALTGSWWLDPSTLKPANADKALDDIEETAEDLIGLLKKSSLPQDVVAHALRELAEAEQQLVSAAIASAASAHGNAKQIANARDELAEAVSALSAGDFDRAFDEFEDAYHYARKAH
jgi:hypothetical protein